MFVFKAQQQAHSELRNYCCNEEDGHKNKLVGEVISCTFLRHIGELDHAPAISPARDLPIFCAEIDQTQYWDDNAVNPTAEYEFDQTVSW